MNKKFSKDEIYSRWDAEMEATKQIPFAQADKYRNLIIMLQTCEILATEINHKRDDKHDQMKMIFRFTIAHFFQLGSGVYQLVKTGLAHSALVLCRSMLETLIDSTYLLLCKKIHSDRDDSERNAWVDYYHLNRFSVYTHWEQFKKHKSSLGQTVENILEENTVQRVKDNATKYQNEYPWAKGGWAKIYPLVKRARAVDDTGWLAKGDSDKGISGFSDISFEQEFITIYKHTSEYTHGESGSFQAFFKYDTEGNNGTVIIGPSHSHVVTAIGLAANYLLVFMYVFVKVNHLDLQKLLDEITQYGFVITESD